jgi:hypothetical protein
MGHGERRGRGIPRWVIIPNLKGSGGKTRMVGEPSNPRPGLTTRWQRRSTAFAAFVAGLAFLAAVAVVYAVVWLLVRLNP